MGCYCKPFQSQTPTIESDPSNTQPFSRLSLISSTRVCLADLLSHERVPSFVCLFSCFLRRLFICLFVYNNVFCMHTVACCSSQRQCPPFDAIVCLSVFQFSWLSFCLSFYLSICLSLYLSVCVSFYARLICLFLNIGYSEPFSARDLGPFVCPFNTL